MLTKMVLKMTLKLTVSIAMMVGVLSYGMYLRGGDPGAMFKGMIGNTVQSAKSSVRGAGNSLKMASPVKSKTTVYQWVDANGVTQFGSTPPAGVAAESKTYKNNVNLMNAQKPVENPQVQADGEMKPGFGPDGERLPGVAGMNLPVNVDPATLSKFLQTMQQEQ